MPRTKDIKVLYSTHPMYNHIVYDPEQREYYNNQVDIFLSLDDIIFYGLRPETLITSPLPSPLPSDYFYNWRTPQFPSSKTVRQIREQDNKIQLAIYPPPSIGDGQPITLWVDKDDLRTDPLHWVPLMMLDFATKLLNARP